MNTFATTILPWLAFGLGALVLLFILIRLVPQLPVLQDLLAKLTPVFIDGLLYVLIAVFGTVQTLFTSEEAYKYVSPYVLFWMKAVIGVALAAVSALKMFRSTSYSDHLKTEADKEPPKKEP